MDDFYDAIMKENSNIPTLKTEMPDTWIHGVLCDPEGTRLSRAVNPLIASAEVLHTQLGIWDIDKPWRVSKYMRTSHCMENILGVVLSL